MPFLAAITLLGWGHLIALFRSLTRPGGVNVLHLLAMTLFMAAVTDTIYLSPLNARGVPGDARNYVPLALFLFGLASCIVFGWKFYTISRTGGDGTRLGWRAGPEPRLCRARALYYWHNH